jgi:hypothetical protein
MISVTTAFLFRLALASVGTTAPAAAAAAPPPDPALIVEPKSAK